MFWALLKQYSFRHSFRLRQNVYHKMVLFTYFSWCLHQDLSEEHLTFQFIGYNCSMNSLESVTIRIFDTEIMTPGSLQSCAIRDYLKVVQRTVLSIFTSGARRAENNNICWYLEFHRNTRLQQVHLYSISHIIWPWFYCDWICCGYIISSWCIHM